MARPTGTASLANLIEQGTLKARDQLVLHRRSKPDITATLRKDGSIKLGDAVYLTPSAAARVALEVGAIDGWIRWRVPRLKDLTLAQIREAAA